MLLPGPQQINPMQQQQQQQQAQQQQQMRMAGMGMGGQPGMGMIGQNMGQQQPINQQVVLPFICLNIKKKPFDRTSWV